MPNNSTRDMEEPIYRMSAVESLLVLVVIGLWLLAVISLARKLERICNPPSIFPNYSLYTKASMSPSAAAAHHDRRSNDSGQSALPPPVSVARATSEPAIDASPRATILIRSPSETCVRVKSTSSLRISVMSQHLTSPSLFGLNDRTTSSHGILTVPRQSRSYQIRVEPSCQSSITQPLLDPNRIPAIVRKSLIDLHRRTLYSNIPSNLSPIRCIVTAAAGGNANGPGSSTTATTTTTTTNTRIPLLNRYRRANDTDDDEWFRDSQSSD